MLKGVLLPIGWVEIAALRANEGFGAKYLINCVNKDGIQGEDKKYLVWETVSGYRHYNENGARMSYWGPPELDWTTPRRVILNDFNSYFCGYV